MLKMIRPLLWLCCLAPVFAKAQPFKRKWVDSVYATLKDEERIGQLFMVAAYSGGPNANQQHIESLVKKNQIGGVIFMQGTPEAQAKLTNRLQKMALVKLMVGMDAEWGLGMRLTGVKDYAKAMTLGATKDTALAYRMAGAIAAQCTRLGVHIDFAPVVDVNNNPKNPVINFRSFGDDKKWVSDLGIAYMNGLQDNGIMACAKHFPGHGDVTVDSHKDLPVISKSRAQLEETELYPFRKLFQAGVKSVMVAHLELPALDSQKNMPSTLSYAVVTQLLQKEMGFGGLIFTDALDMKALTNYYPDGETDLKAFIAGNDVLLFSQNVPLAIQKIQWAIKTGKVPEAELERRVKKILAAKYDLGLWRYSPIKEQAVTEDLNKDWDVLMPKIAQASITLVGDKSALLKRLQNPSGKFCYVNVNGPVKTELQMLLQKKYPGMTVQRLPNGPQPAPSKPLATDPFDVVVVGIHAMSNYPGKNGYYGLDTAQVNTLKQLSKKTNVVFVIMGNPYLQQIIGPLRSTLVGYEDNMYSQSAMFKVLTGESKPSGSLPFQIFK